MEAPKKAQIQVVAEDHGIQAGMEEQTQQIPARSNRPIPNTAQMDHVVGLRVGAMEKLMNFNIGQLSVSFILFTLQMHSDVPETEIRTVMVLAMLSFGVSCFSSGLAALIAHKMRVWRDRGNAKAQGSRTVKLLMWVVSLLSIAGMICLLASMVLSFEVEVGKFGSQEWYIKALMVVGCSSGFASSLAYFYIVVDAFLYW